MGASRRTVEEVAAPPNGYTDPAISPDGRFAAVSIQGPMQTLWIYDFARSALTTMASMGSSQAPLWTPDGRRVIYRSTTSGSRNLFWRSGDGGGDEERLTTGNRLQTPGSISDDGAILLFTEVLTGHWPGHLDARSAPIAARSSAAHDIVLQRRLADAVA
jgi:Tol biopolymer transport system component